ncbi:MAG: translation initiation inhibitor [Prevotella sp.]|nr:translation initiation inhibitor [Prevotella sp.]
MNNYHILTPPPTGTFATQLQHLSEVVHRLLQSEKQEGRTLHYTKVFLSDAANQERQLMASALVSQHLGLAALTVIQQPPVSGAKLALLLKTSDEPSPYVLHSIRLTDEEAAHQGSYVQTIQLFDKYMAHAKEMGVSLRDHCVRTWLYVRDIDANYNGMVRARNDVFRQHGLTTDTHFIASTGIGGRTGERNVLVAADFLTYPDVKEEQKTYLQALDHLNPTHEYGVAFERATRITLPSGLQQFLVSGTASIDRHGQVVHEGDVRRQTRRLLENIEALLKNGGATLADVKYFIVYLRDLADAADVEQLLSELHPQTPHILTLAEVCRPQWLVEMECIAENSPS